MDNKRKDSIPYFCWDRNLTVSDIKNKLKTLKGREKDQFVAWILREAAFRDVWTYISPAEVAGCLPRIQNSLGRWKDFWNYITRTWHELGKI